MAAELLNANFVEEVWFVPVGDRTDKALNGTRFQRLEMVQAGVEDMFKGTDYE